MSCRCYQVPVTNAFRLKRGDPTRTLGISRRFIAELRRRMRKLQIEVRKFMVDLDALGLKNRGSFVQLVGEREFEFRTDAGKLQAFNTWFKQQIDEGVLSVPPGADFSRPWTSEYVDSAYKRGQLNAYLSSKQAQLLGELGVGEETAEAFLRSSFLAPETVSKLQLLGTRVFEELKGVTASMGAEMNRILSAGIADGSNPRDIARTMQASIQSLTRRRAETIARTEVIHAHAEGQLDAFQKLGVDELGIVAEWSTAGDDRVCPDCFAREGETYTVKEARNLIPLHPNCRCTWVPVPE